MTLRSRTARSGQLTLRFPLTTRQAREHRRAAGSLDRDLNAFEPCAANRMLRLRPIDHGRARPTTLRIPARASTACARSRCSRSRVPPLLHRSGTEQGWLPGGFLGVEVFFVVSGYLITSLLLAERRETGRRLASERSGSAAAAGCCRRCTCCSASSSRYALAVPARQRSRRCRATSLAALTYTSNWWQIIADRSYFAEVGPARAAEAPVVARDRGAVLSVLAAAPDARARASSAARARSSRCSASRSSSTIAHGHRRRSAASTTRTTRTFTRLSGLLLGSMMAFFFAPYRIRGMPGRGARIALDLAGADRAASCSFVVVPRRSRSRSPTRRRRPRRLPRRLPVRRHRDAARHRGGRAPRLGSRADSSAAGRCAWIGLRSYSLYLWHYPIFCVTRPALDFDYFFHLRGWPVLRAAHWGCRSARPSCRTGSSKRRSATARSAGTANGCGRPNGQSNDILARRGSSSRARSSCSLRRSASASRTRHRKTEKFAGRRPTAGQPDPNAIIKRCDRRRRPPRSRRRRTHHDDEDAASPARPAEAAARSTTTTTTMPHRPSPAVLAIGDSVMHGARGALGRRRFRASRSTRS